MEINVSKIIEDKLAQMEAEGTVKKAIEDQVEKTILRTITDGIDSWEVKRAIQEQLKDSVSNLAKDCGLSAYNGFIVNQVRQVVSGLYSRDITEKIQTALDTMLVRKHENVKLSDIFNAYREYILEATEAHEKYEYERFEASLSDEESGSFHHYRCRFADHELETHYSSYGENADVEIRFCIYGDRKSANISSVILDGNYLDKVLQIGTLNEFEAFVVNLYLNKTEIEMDLDAVDDFDTSYDVDI